MLRIYVQDLVIAYLYWILCMFGTAAGQHSKNELRPLNMLVLSQQKVLA